MKVTEVIIPQEITLLIVFSVALNLLRVALFSSYSLIYLLWNIFLAFLPFLISSILAWHVHHAKVSRYEYIVGGFMWLILFPNAPYIITDLVHLGYSHTVPLWFDALLIFSCAWVGLQLGFYSLFHIEEMLLMRYKNFTVQLIMLFTLAFSSFGIYLGRFLRFNSWDIFTNPLSLLHEWLGIFGNTYLFYEALLFSSLFYGFLLVSYTAWKLSKNIRW